MNSNAMSGALECLTMILLIALLGTSSASAKARFMNRDEMIGSSDLIAVVDVVKVTKVDPKLTCSDQRVRATVKTIIKGNHAEQLTFIAPCFYPCAITNVAAGPQIVFLKIDSSRSIPIVGTNWMYSYRPIRDSKVEWFKDGKSLDLTNRPMSKVVSDINAIIKTQPPEQQEGPPCKASEHPFFGLRGWGCCPERAICD